MFWVQLPNISAYSSPHYSHASAAHADVLRTWGTEHQGGEKARNPNHRPRICFRRHTGEIGYPPTVCANQGKSSLDSENKAFCLPISSEVLREVDSQLNLDDCLRQSRHTFQ